MAEEFRIVRGVPTDEELAAIVGVLLLRAAAPPAPDAGRTNAWVASARPAYAYPDGRPSRPGRSAWRASAFPR
jgi:acyl-CoA carboxylase epsilon subunit-like protein